MRGKLRSLLVTTQPLGRFSRLRLTAYLVVLLLVSISAGFAQIVRTHTVPPGGSAEASTAVGMNNGTHMFVADNETEVIGLYDRTLSAAALSGFNVRPCLAPPTVREVDIEASTRDGDLIVWLGSHSNTANSGAAQPSRYRLFGTVLSGTGVGNPPYSLSFTGRYDGLRTDLINWDSGAPNNGQYNLAGSAAPGVAAESIGGFNIEGLAMVPSGVGLPAGAAYIGFRAPLVPINNRTRALVVPLLNMRALVSCNLNPSCNPPSAACGGPAQFGNAIELNLGGRGIRSIEGNGTELLIIAGPAAGPGSFQLYTWNGNANSAPVPHVVIPGGFTTEGIVSVPNPLTGTSPIQMVCDEGGGSFRSITLNLDAPTITLEETDAAAYEGDGGAADTGTITVRRTSGNLNLALTVNISISGTAGNGTDYTSIPTTVNFPPSVDTQVITVTPIDDALAEFDETVTVAIVGNTAAYVVGSGPGTVTIFGKTLSIFASDPFADEAGDRGEYTITRGGRLNQQLTVNFSVDPASTATLNVDYTINPSSPVTFGIGESTKIVTLRPIADSILEGTETAIITLSPVGEYAFLQPSANVDIFQSTVIFVSGSAPGPVHDGESWDTAFLTIQQGINAAPNGLTVMVAPGVYNERTDFLGKQIAVRSTNPDNPSLYIINAGGFDSPVKMVSGEPSGTTLEGFTLTGGWNTGSSSEPGGGIWIVNSSPTIAHCRIEGNLGDFAGGIAICNGSPVIRHCIIQYNQSHGGTYGAGLIHYCGGNSTIENCVIWANSTDTGGAILLGNTASMSVNASTISGNVQTGYTSGYGGAGITHYSSGSLTIQNSILWGNYNQGDPNLPEIYAGGPITINASDVRGGFAGFGNIDANPLFGADFHLSMSSPCIDAGSSGFGQDIDGDIRVLDGNGDGNPVVDMGADEYLLAPPPQPFLSAYYDSDLQVIHLGFSAANAAHFTIVRKGPGEPGFSILAENVTAQSYDDANISLGVYEYKVTAFNILGASPESAPASAESLLNPALAIAWIGSPHTDGQDVWFHWSEPAVTYDTVEFRRAPNCNSEWTGIAGTVSIAGDTITLTGELTPEEAYYGNPYCYQARVRWGAQFGPWANCSD